MLPMSTSSMIARVVSADGDAHRTRSGPACRLIIVSNHLPLRVKRGAAGWEFEWDEDALVGQAKVRSECAAGQLRYYSHI